MDLLYQFFLYPLEISMGWILAASYRMTGNHGASLLLLSLGMNVALLPVYLLTEKWQAAERQVQHTLQPKLQKIRKAFSGKERFTMIHTLYRQVGYHPIYALRSSVRMLLQVPLLFAAFHLLSEYPPLEGVSFFVFDDLMKPDGLLWGVNLMPLVMTGVSVFSVLFYTPPFSGKERWQFYIVSILFLIWLYSSPVALVLFWTFNIMCSWLMNVASARLNPTPVLESNDVTMPSASGSNLHVPMSNSAGAVFGSSNKWFGRGKEIMQSPYLLALLVGVYPIVFYISNNWEIFNVSDGLSVSAIFVCIVFLVMSVSYLGISWAVRKISSNNHTIIIQRVFVLCAILMLAYLLRETFLEIAENQLWVFVSIVALLAFGVSWLIPTIQMYRVNMVLTVMCIFHMGSGLHSIGNAEANHLVESSGEGINRELYEHVKFSRTPNVYYIVPDGYPNQEGLKKIYSIDNTAFFHELESWGFVILHEALSNYRNTFWSLTSSFGMEHHFYRKKFNNVKFSDHSFISSSQNPVVHIFMNNGYQINFIHGNEWAFTRDCFVDLCSPNVFLGEFLDVLIPPSLQSEFLLPIELDRSFQGSIRRILKYVELLPDHKAPHFTYVHLKPPGHSTHRVPSAKQLVSFRKRFPKKIKKANSDLSLLIESIITRDPDVLIVINADHGAWGLGNYKKSPLEFFRGVSDKLIGIDHLGVLLAIRWPDGSTEYGQDLRTNVNVFRHIFSYLSQDNTLLKTKADDHGFITRKIGSTSMLIKVVHDGKVPENMVEIGPR